MSCKRCGSQNVTKFGSYVTRGQRVQRFKCKACLKTFTKRTFSKNYRMRKQRLAPMITQLYCEGMSQRAIARVLKVNVKTVEKYFIRESHEACKKNLKDLDEGLIQTSYVQCDEVQTFEHSHKRPLGIQLAIRPKDSTIVSIKVCRIPMNAVRASRAEKDAYAKISNRTQKKTELALDLEKALTGQKRVQSDGKYFSREIINKVVSGVDYQSSPHRQNPLWRLDKAVLMMRQNVSRLRRSTLATTKRIERLQNHLDLYLQYHNELKLSRK